MANPQASAPVVEQQMQYQPPQQVQFQQPPQQYQQSPQQQVQFQQQQYKQSKDEKSSKNIVIGMALLVFLIIVYVGYQYYMSYTRNQRVSTISEQLYNFYANMRQLITSTSGQDSAMNNLKTSANNVLIYSSPNYDMVGLFNAIINNLNPAINYVRTGRSGTDRLKELTNKVYSVMTSKGFTNNFASVLSNDIGAAIMYISTKDEAAFANLQLDFINLANIIA